MIAAIVLAAGYSSRMGRFKPLLPIGHATALERVIDLFLAAGVGEINVVTGHHAEAMDHLLKHKGVHATHNPHYGSGMYSSVAAGVGSLPAQVEACFVLPADMPLVRPRTIKLLAQAYESHPRPVIYPVFQALRGHPPFGFALIFPPDFYPRLAMRTLRQQLRRIHLVPRTEFGDEDGTRGEPVAGAQGG